ncbi:hypothetical protein ZIOFF_075949 [Zingiber officinale]|uniref:Mitochondrial protein n=1 Tax=Zingiber officinale TaxID=94328 RepID=A0A8J5C0H7_ZINOF|nr:hypothetical protein ZIOFF_075949 [Zingiber officinale]
MSSPESPQIRMSWVDMAQEDKLKEVAAQEEKMEEPGRTSIEGATRVKREIAKKETGLSREQREEIHFRNVVRKKDFICLERANDKIINILNVLELHTGVFSTAEQKRIVDLVCEMQEKGKNHELGGSNPSMEDGSFISQAGYAREILKKFKMDNSKSINTPVECGVKLSKYDEEEKVDLTFFKSLVGSLRYLTCTRPDILYVAGLVSRYMEDPTTTHLKIAKRILRYIKGTIDFGLLYSTSNHFKLEGYSDSDWGGDIDDRKSTTGFVFFMGDTTFTWMPKK